jgi:hypothetical protein
MSKKIMSMLFALHLLLSRLFGVPETKHAIQNARVGLMLSSPNACLIFARVSVALFPRFARNLILFRCRINRDIGSG